MAHYKRINSIPKNGGSNGEIEEQQQQQKKMTMENKIK